VVRYYDVTLSESLQNLISSFMELQESDNTVSYFEQLIVNILLSTRELIVLLSSCKKPESNSFNALISPIITGVSDITALSLRFSTSPNNPFYVALSEGAQAFLWITSNTPLMHVTQVRSNFFSSRSNPSLSPFESQTSSFLSLLCRLEGYLEICNKQGLSWKGTQDVPAALHWNFRGLQLFPTQVTQQASKNSKICEPVSAGKQENVESIDQRVFVLHSSDGVITISGTPLFVSIESCSFTTVKILVDTPLLDISNCQFVKIECVGNIGSINLERCKGCVLELNNSKKYEISTISVMDLKVFQSSLEAPISTISSITSSVINGEVLTNSKSVLSK